MKKIIILALALLLTGCAAKTINTSANVSGSKKFFAIDEDSDYPFIHHKNGRFVVVDLSDGPHFVNDDMIIEWHGESLAKLSNEEIEKIEKQMVASLGDEVTVFDNDNGVAAGAGTVVSLKGPKTLKETVEYLEAKEKTGFEYLRVPCANGSWPSAAKIDVLIKTFKNAPGTEAVFVGSEKSVSAVMYILDLIYNPDLTYEVLSPRLDKSGDDELPEEERVSYMAKQFADYANDVLASGRETSFNDWLLTNWSITHD